ncbi:MAG TPA: plastocyanin/azurin family copper-binding protein, partial [Frankiaceae bacterium]|nr:plastocyanin/azurin family copper-binding protein [Frankiaceae bacterium]
SVAVLATALALVACSPSATPTTAPAGTTAPAATTAATTGQAATSAPAATTAAAAPCADSTGTTTVSASVANFTWSQPINAKVGDVITWANDDSAPHRVVLDDGSCGMSGNIAGGGKRSLVFTVAGTYAFHCSVHPTMKGTITIS